MIKLIALNGFAGSGKDTVAEILKNQLSAYGKVRIISLTELSKSSINWSRLFGEYTYEDAKERNPDLVRLVIEKFCEEVIKPIYGSEAFTEPTLNKITDYHFSDTGSGYLNSIFIIPDLGLEADFKVIKDKLAKRNVMAVKVTNNRVRYDRSNRENIATDFTITNDGNYDELVSNTGKLTLSAVNYLRLENKREFV
jgi:adenylate kinase